MRLLAITQRVDTNTATQERRDGLDQNWTRFLMHAGFIALALPNRLTAAHALLDTSRPSGIVLTGGGDLACLGGDSPERDEVEIFLLKQAETRGIPLLGVCRGMEAILHRFNAPLAEVDGHIRSRHTIASPDGETREVNSYHRFAARDPGRDMIATFYASDGTIEAIRHRTLPKLEGIMWHPEREEYPSEHDIALFQRLFGEIR